MEGTATVTVTTGVVTYGASATLQYNTATARTASSEEWISPFTATGGVIIKNTGTITLNGNKTFTSCPLTVEEGATLANGGFTIASPSALNLDCGGLTAGATISGTGTLTLGGDVSVTDAGNGSAGATISCPVALGATRTFTVADDGSTAADLTISGSISGSTFGVTKAGAGTMELSANNTYTGTTTVSAGTLQLGAAGVIPNSSAFVLNGGTFSSGATTGFGETFSTLDLNASSSIALGTGSHNLLFSNSNAVSWTSGATLTITGWTGGYDGTSGTAGKIFVGSDATGLTATQLAQIRFFNGTGYSPATILSTGEVVPLAGTIFYSRATGNWNSNTTWSYTLGGPAVGAGIFPVAGDVVNIQSSNTVTVNVNSACATLQVGGTAANGSSTAGALTFSASSTLTVSGSVQLGGDGSNSRDGTITFTSGSTLDAGSVTLGGSVNPPGQGIINMSAGGTLKPGSLAVGAGAGTWNPGTGTVELDETNTLPATLITSFRNLIINGGTTTISAATSIVNGGSLSLTSGTLAAGSNLSMSSTSSITRSEGSLTGTLQGTGDYDVTFTGTSKTTGPELGGSDLRNVTVNLSSGQTLTLSANAAPDGNLTITAGTFDLSTFTFNRSAAGGSMTVNGTLKLGGNTGGQTGSNFPTNFTPAITEGTVNYNRAGAQTVYATPEYGYLVLSGSGTKTFGGDVTVINNLSISSGVVAELPNSTTSSATTLTLGGVDQITGSWGSTASAAVNTNDTYFLSTTSGIINAGSGTQTFSTAGTFTFNVPAGVTCVMVETRGGGGGGGISNNDSRGGGGGGAYASKILTGVSGSYTVVVGAGGGQSTGGGSSYFNTSSLVDPASVVADGGSAGGSGGGAGGTTANSNGTILSAGGAGGSRDPGNGGGGGGQAGCAAGTGRNGQAGGSSSGGLGGGKTGNIGVCSTVGAGGNGGSPTNDGQNGVAPGGGGGGCGDDNGGVDPNSGSGAAGEVIVSWSVIAVTTSNACIGGGTVTFTQTGGGSGGTWSVSGGGTIVGSTGVFTPTTAGCFTATYTPAGGCPGSADFTVYPTEPTITAPSNACNTALTLPSVAAVSGFTVQYNIDGQGFTGSQAAPATTGCHTFQARYVNTNVCGSTAALTASANAACDASNTVSAVVFPAAPAAPVVSNTCNTALTVPALSAISGFNAQYSFNNVWGSSNVSSSTPGAYAIKTRYVLAADCGSTVAGTAGPGACAESGETTANIYPLPSDVTVSGGGNFCGSATITASNGGSGTIYFQGTTSGGTSTATPSTSEVVTSSGTYYFRARSAEGCWGAEGSATVTTNAGPADPGNPTSNSPQCANVGVTLTRSGTPPAGVTWYWQTSASGTSTANSGATFNVTSSGTYYLRAQADAGLCWSTGAGSVSVTVNANPTAGTCNAVGDPCYANAGYIQVSASGGLPPYNVTWAPAHGMSQPAVINTDGGTATITGLQGGQQYIFTVTDSNGCSAQ